MFPTRSSESAVLAPMWLVPIKFGRPTSVFSGVGGSLLLYIKQKLSTEKMLRALCENAPQTNSFSKLRNFALPGKAPSIFVSFQHIL